MFYKKRFLCIIIFAIFYPVATTALANGDGETEIMNITINESYLTYEEQDETNPFAFLMLQRYFLLGWVSLIVIIIGILGNVFTIIVLKHPTMKSAINIHFTGLAISDLTCLILILLSIPLRHILGLTKF
jgi:hypothetical protein